MNMETTVKQFLDGVCLPNSIIENHTTIPILSMIKINSNTVTSTNLDVEISSSLATAKKAKNPFCLDAKNLSKVLAHADGDTSLKLETDRSGNTTASFNGSQYPVLTLPADEYPHMHQDFDALKITRAGNVGLKAAMKAVRFAISHDETRYYLNGVCLTKNENGQPFVVAVDGFILAAMPIDVLPDAAMGKIVPHNLVALLLRMNGEPESVGFADGLPIMSATMTGGVFIKAKLIDGTFPDWTRLLPQESKPLFSANPDDLKKILRRLAAFSDGTRASKVNITVGTTGEISLYSRSISVDGEAREKTSYTSDRFGYQACFSARYLIDICNAFSGHDLIEFDQVEASHPCRITSPTSKLVTLLMPMRM